MGTFKTNQDSQQGLLPRPFARRFGLGERAVYNGIHDGSIPAIKVGNRYVILVDQWIRRGLSGGDGFTPESFRKLNVGVRKVISDE